MPSNAPIDENDVKGLIAASSADGKTPVKVYADPSTHRLLVDSAGGGTGTVTEVDTGTGLTGGPITTSGTVSLDSKLAPLDTLGSPLQSIRVNAGQTALEYYTPSTGAPGGLNTQIQYNNSGAFGGITGATTDGTAVSLNAAHLLNPTINGAGVGLATLTYPNTASSATITVPATTGTLALTSDLTGFVTAVSGTSNRITSSGGTTPAIDISASYVGQSSITTLGTVATGTWSATTIALNKGGTGQTTKAAAFDALSPMSASGDIIYGGTAGTGTRLAKGSDTQILTLASGLPTWAAPATAGTVTAVSIATANGFSGSSSGGATPALTIVAGAITPTTVNGNTFTTGSYTLTGTAAKTLNFTNSLTLSGTDSTTMTFPSTTAMVARTDAAQTFTGTQTFSQVITTANAITATSNAATIPVTSRHNIVTNNSAATLTITLTTSGAVNMQTVVVQILDSSAVAQTVTWVNTENSTVTAPVTSNGSTTLPLTVGFMYNLATSKWRCIASA